MALTPHLKIKKKRTKKKKIKKKLMASIYHQKMKVLLNIILHSVIG
jgi:hypothetical protein